MTTPVTNPNPNISGIEAYDDNAHQVVKLRAKNVTTDSTASPPIVVGDLGVQVEVETNEPTSSTGTPTSVAGSASAVALLASNTARKGAYIYNDSAATLYIGLFAHATLTTSVYTTQVPPGNLYEMPTSPVYTGEISGIWSSATGNARITEMS